MSGHDNLRPIETLEEWAEAWGFVTAVCTVRIHNIDVDQAAMLADHNTGDVISVLLEFVFRILDSLNLADATTVCQLWGLMAAGAVVP